MLKKLFTLVFFCFLSNLIFGQLLIKKDELITPNKESVKNFIEINNLDYAVIAWHTSTWMSSFDYFSGLVKQNGKWYLMKISSPSYSLPHSYKMTISSKKLNRKELKLLMASIKIDSAFLYTQDQLSSLPDQCSYEKDGKPAGLLFVADASTYHNVKFEMGGFNSLSFYAPDVYLSKCYPYFADFKMLKGLVDTTRQLFLATKNLE